MLSNDKCCYTKKNVVKIHNVNKCTGKKNRLNLKFT